MVHIIRPGQMRGLFGFPFRHDDRLHSFDRAGTFDAMIDAERWLREHGFSIGSNQGGDPRGILFGTVRIAKWRGLSDMERADLDGVMLSPNGRTFRMPPITVRLRSDAMQQFTEISAGPTREQAEAQYETGGRQR